MLKMFIGCFFTAMSAVASATDMGFSIAATYDETVNVITISWKNNEPCTQQFILQKSDNEQDWINVDTLYNSEVFNDQVINWEYRSPLRGGTYFRLEAVVDDFNSTFSKPVYVKIDPPLFEWGIDPESKKDKLTLQYEGRGKIKGVINVLMQSMSGRVLFRSRSSSTTKTIDIPVGNLGKGNYDIQIYVEGELIWSQHFKKQTIGSGMVCKLL
jgi:hypothetical protein